MELAELYQLTEQYGNVLYAFCIQLAGSRQEGEDLYQETFLKAVELHVQIDRARNPKSFLIAVAAHLWRNRRRKYAWRQRIAPTEPLSEQVEQSEATLEEGPEYVAIQRELEQQVCRAVAALPDKLKLPVYMYYIADLSTEEITGLLHIPAGTVKSRLYKARKILRDVLGGAME